MHRVFSMRIVLWALMLEGLGFHRFPRPMPDLLFDAQAVQGFLQAGSIDA